MPHAPHPLTFGVCTPQHNLTWPQLVEQWQMAEELGFDSIWLMDHFMALTGESDGPCLEASTLLAALALKTNRVQVGVLVYGNTHRHPAVLAKEMATVDHLSDGRAIFGIGAGWNEDEHRRFGIPFPTAGDRVAMLDEALTMIRSLLTERRTTVDGQYYRLHDAPFSPKPVQSHMPIMIGGKRPKMLHVIAKHADLWDSDGPPAELRARGEAINRHCAEIGRDPTEIVWSLSLGAERLEDEAAFPALVRSYCAAGVGQFLFDFPITTIGQQAAARVARDLVPALREELAPST